MPEEFIRHPPTIVSQLSDKHDVSAFDCGDAEINSFLKDKARVEQLLQFSRTYVLHYYGEARVLAFVTIAMGSIAKKEDAQSVRAGKSDEPVGILYIAYVGRDVHIKNAGWGRYMVRFAIAEARRLSQRLGCRGVGLNCYEEKDRVVKMYESLFFKKKRRNQDPSTHKWRWFMWLDFVTDPIEGVQSEEGAAALPAPRTPALLDRMPAPAATVMPAAAAAKPAAPAPMPTDGAELLKPGELPRPRGPPPSDNGGA